MWNPFAPIVDAVTALWHPARPEADALNLQGLDLFDDMRYQDAEKAFARSGAQ